MALKNVINGATTRLVDVRSKIEFDTGHVTGAVNIPLDQLQHRYKEIEDLGDVPVVFYCRSGNRSSQAVSHLRHMGFDNIYNGGSIEEVQRYRK